MWIDEQGVLHTVAPPDWREVLSAESARQLRASLPKGRRGKKRVLEEIQQVREHIYDELQGIKPALDEEIFVGALPPIPLEVNSSSSPSLLQAFQTVDTRWRLDVLDAFEESL